MRITQKQVNRGLASSFQLCQLLRRVAGATAVEYGLIAALISVVIIAAVTSVGTQLQEDLHQRQHGAFNCKQLRDVHQYQGGERDIATPRAGLRGRDQTRRSEDRNSLNRQQRP